MSYIISRPAIVQLACKAARKASGTHRIGAVITYGTGNKPIVVGHNSNARSTFHIGRNKNRIVLCSQHAEMSAVAQLLRRQYKGTRFE
jgi:hypothetical protein